MLEENHHISVAERPGSPELCVRDQLKELVVGICGFIWNVRVASWVMIDL